MQSAERSPAVERLAWSGRHSGLCSRPANPDERTFARGSVPLRRPIRSAMAENEQVQSPGGFDRRKFLTRTAVAATAAYTVPVVTTVGLSRATATPCAGIAAAATEPQLSADATAQRAARSNSTHSPCYQRCMEQRAKQEHDADVAFYASVEAAGDNDRLLIDSAHQYRQKLAELVRDFRACNTNCT